MNYICEIKEKESILIAGGETKFVNCSCKDPEGLKKCRVLCDAHQTYGDHDGLVCKSNCYSAYCLPKKC